MNPVLMAGLGVFTLVFSLTPGPNNLLLIATGAKFGLRRSLPHVAGVCLGLGAMSLAVGLALAGLSLVAPWLHATLRWLSAAYILYLVCRMATAKGFGQGVAGSWPTRFWQAAAFQWINPKAWAMSVGAMTLYTEPDRRIADAVLIAGLFLVVAVPCSLGWAAAGLDIKRRLQPRRTLRLFNGAMAALLALSLFPLALSPPRPAPKLSALSATAENR